MSAKLFSGDVARELMEMCHGVVFWRCVMEMVMIGVLLRYPLSWM